LPGARNVPFYVAVLEEGAVSPVPAVEGDGVSREEASRQCRDGHRAGLEEQVHMGGHESPGAAGRARLLEELAKPFEKYLPVGVVPEELPAFDPPHDDMLERARSVNASLAGHGITLPQAEAERTYIFMDVLFFYKAT
jgi:hypothetical protein